MANIQIGTNLRNCKITLAAEFYQPWGVLFSFQNNTTDVINSSSFTDTSIPGGMTVYDVNGSGIFSSVNINGFTSYGTLDATTFDIPNDKDYIVSTLDDGFTTATYEPLTSNIQIPITKNGKTTLATKGTKNVEDIDINVDISPTIQSLSITPSETSQTFNASNVDGYKPVNVSAIQTETPSVNLSLASGNQVVNASSGKYIKSLTIKKPSTLIGSNIKKNVVIAGITGTYEFKTQNKTFTPTQTGGSVSADSGYDGLGVVTVNPVPLGNKTDVPLNFYNQTAGTIADSQNIYSDENKFMTWASVSRPSTLIAENIKKDINIAGITGTLESGGASLNIAYGGTAPSDTSKLWITGSEPENLLLIGGTPEPILEDKISTLPALSVTLPTLPTAASAMGTAAVGTKIYLFGGNSDTGRLNTIQVFDTINSTISTLSTTLPDATEKIEAVAVGTKIYLFGGYSLMTGSLDTIQVFDTTNNTISTLSTKLPHTEDGIGIAAVGTKIYLFGGHYWNSSNSSVYLDTIQVFDTTNNTISTLSTKLPTPTTNMGAAAAGTKIYLFGGENWSGSKHYRFNTIRVFDTTNNTISTLSTTLPEKTSSMGIAAVGTRIYLFGGYYFNSSNSTASLNTIQVFDTTNNTILTPLATLSNTTTESVIHTATVGTNIYLFGVEKGSYDTIQLFDTVNSTISTFATTSLTAAYGIGTAAVGTKIYLFGGRGNKYLNTIQVFDTTNNTISTLSTTLPTAAFSIGTVAVGTKIYLFGGYISNGRLNTINVFDTTNNTISTLPTTLPTATDDIGTVAVGTKIYLFGGNDSSGRLNTIRVFDTTNNTITTLSTTLPTAASGIGVTRVGTQIYLFGGYVSGSPYYLNTIQVFDTTNNTITTLSTTLPTNTEGIGTAGVGTKIYLFGGNGSSGTKSTIRVFDTTNNTISTLSITLPTNAKSIGTTAVGAKIYLFGGYVEYGVDYLNTVNIFSSRIYLNPNSILITESQQENIFNLLSSPTQVEISVKNVYRGDSSNIAQLNNAYLYDGTNWVNVNTGKIHQGGHVLTVARDGYGGTLGITKFDGTKQNIVASDTPTTVSGVVSIDSVSYAASQDKHLSPDISIPFTLTDDITITVTSWCFIEGTPITLANHTYKNVEDITYDDNLLVWDFDKGEFSQAKPLWIMKQKQAIKYNHLVFSDNSELNTVEQHRIFNIEKGMFTYPMTEDTPIGTHTLNDKGEIVELVSKEVVEKEVNYYNIITNYHINLFAGHILTSCRLSNIYPIKDFKYVKDNREIIPFEKFNVPKEYYDGLRLGEQPTDINRDNADYHGDNSVEDYVKRLIRSKK